MQDFSSDAFVWLVWLKVLEAVALENDEFGW